MVQSRLRCIVEWMPRVYGGSPGKPRSRSGSQFGKSALVYSRRIGCAEIVVNSDWRSGLFSRVGWRVFFSQACSLAEGLRCAEEVSAGGAVCVVPLDSSLMGLAPGGRNQTAKQIGTEFNAIRKVEQGQERRDGRGREEASSGTQSRQKKKPARESLSEPA